MKACLEFFKKENGSLLRGCPGPGIHGLRAAGRGVPVLPGLQDSGSPVLSDGGGGRLPVHRSLHPPWPEAPGRGREREEAFLCAGVSVLLFQHDHHKRCGAYHLRTLHHSGVPDDGKGEKPVKDHGTGNHRGQSGKHGHAGGKPENLYLYSSPDISMSEFLGGGAPLHGSGGSPALRRSLF